MYCLSDRVSVGDTRADLGFGWVLTLVLCKTTSQNTLGFMISFHLAEADGKMILSNGEGKM